MKGSGIALIVIGIVMMIFRTINFTAKEKVADLGPIEISKEKEKTVNWPLYAGAVVTISGVIILIAAGKNKV